MTKALRVGTFCRRLLLAGSLRLVVGMKALDGHIGMRMAGDGSNPEFLGQLPENLLCEMPTLTFHELLRDWR